LIHQNLYLILLFTAQQLGYIIPLKEKLQKDIDSYDGKEIFGHRNQIFFILFEDFQI